MATKTRKEAKGKPKAKGIGAKNGETQIRGTVAAAEQIHSLANQLFEALTVGHKAIGLNRPSAKVAIDYLIVAAARDARYKTKSLSPKNNLYLRICDDDSQEV